MTTSPATPQAKASYIQTGQEPHGAERHSHLISSEGLWLRTHRDRQTHMGKDPTSMTLLERLTHGPRTPQGATVHKLRRP